MSSFVVSLVRRCIYENRKFLFYCHDPKNGDGCIDPYITAYTVWNDIPPSFRRVLAPNPRFYIMIIRMKRKQARVLCCSDDKQNLIAYGWIQNWKPFRRRFGKITKEGSMLGPYWTAPGSRRQGLYSRLLSHSIALCSKEWPIMIYTSPENIASQKGIQKAGFETMGKWEKKRWFGIISRFRRISP